MNYFLGLCLLLISINSLAAIFLQKNNGNVTYSDTPLENATEVNVPTTNSSPESQPSVSNAPKKATPEAVIKKPYTTFVIASPTNQTTFQNDPSIKVSTKLEPELQQGDKIQLYVDGKPLGGPVENNTISMGRIDRGAHQIYAVLIQDQKIIKKTESIIIYVHYGSVRN